MLSENIRALRKQKGYTQEMLAQQLNVVRQTVSKWEKGLSVPDAEMLESMAELFEVPVSELLGSRIPEQEQDDDRVDEIAKQLAVLNDQLANQSARRRKTVRRVLIGTPAALLIMFVVYLGLFVLFGYREDANTTLSRTTIECTLDGETYGYEFIYDQNFEIRAAGGDSFIAEHIDLDLYGDVNECLAHIEDYFVDHGGTYRIVVDGEEYKET